MKKNVKTTWNGQKKRNEFDQYELFSWVETIFFFIPSTLFLNFFQIFFCLPFAFNLMHTIFVAIHGRSEKKNKEFEC